MSLGRTITAVLIAWSLALLALAGAFASEPTSAQTVATEVQHGSPCDEPAKAGNDSASIGTCANCFSYIGVASGADVAAPFRTAAPVVAPLSPVVSQIGKPPFRPPRV
jgi:hypothetical protein